MVPWDRVVELHIAGGRLHDEAGLPWIEDDHGPEVLPDTWQIAAEAARRATNLKAIIVECERNPIPAVLPIFARAQALLAPEAA